MFCLSSGVWHIWRKLENLRYIYQTHVYSRVSLKKLLIQRNKVKKILVKSQKM